MKKLQLLPILLVVLMLASCNSVQVAVDYDKEANFASYNSFAFYKPGIDAAKISDLDKKRILRAIEAELTGKGMIKDGSPKVLVSIFTKENERVDVYNNNFGYGWGWNPYWYGGWGGSTVTTTTEGTLYIDIIDAAKNELIWQGIGKADLNFKSMEKKEEQIRKIVHEILLQFPPGSTQK